MDRSLVVVVALAVLVATPGIAGAVAGVFGGPADGPAVTPADDGTDATAGTDADATAANGSVNVTTGSQLSTVLAATEAEVGAEVSASAFERRFEAGNESERAAAVADRAATLRRDAAAVAAAYREAVAAYRNGTIDRLTFAQRLASLDARADSLRASVDRLRSRAANVSALELETAGYDESTLDAAEADLDAVSGSGSGALLRRFTGQTDGSVEVDAEGGVSVEVENEGGERSREVRRPTDDDDNLTVSQTAALDAARAALSDRGWTLREASVHEGSGYYKFEFGFSGNETGEAEVRVDGSTGEVFRIEEEIEPGDERGEGRPDEPGEDRGDEQGDDRDSLTLLVVAGEPAPNATVTLEARRNGSVAADVPVRVDGEPVGTTGSDGRIDVRLGPGETEIEAGDGEAELEFEFETDERDLRGLNVSAGLADGTVSVSVTYRGAGVAGASVEANGDRVGTTGDDGSVSFALGNSTELELGVTRGELEVERTFHVENGSLVPGEADDEGEEGEEGEGEGEDGEGEEGEEGESERGEGEEGDERTLELAVVDGDPAPNATVTVRATVDGDPASGVTVRVDDRRVGTTGPDGTIAVTLGAEDTEVTATRGDLEAELEFEFDDEGDGSEREGSEEGENEGEGTGSPEDAGEDEGNDEDDTGDGEDTDDGADEIDEDDG